VIVKELGQNYIFFNKCKFFLPWLEFFAILNFFIIPPWSIFITLQLKGFSEYLSIE